MKNNFCLNIKARVRSVEMVTNWIARALSKMGSRYTAVTAMSMRNADVGGQIF